MMTDVRSDAKLFDEFFAALREFQTDLDEDKLTEFLRVLDGVIGSGKYDDRWTAMWLLAWLKIVIRKRFPDGVGGSNTARVVDALSVALADLENGVVANIVEPKVPSHRIRDKLPITVLKAACLVIIEQLVASGLSRADAKRQILSRGGAMASAFGAWGQEVTKSNLATWDRERRKPKSYLNEIFGHQKEVFDALAAKAGSFEAGLAQYVRHLPGPASWGYPPPVNPASHRQR
jgi:hypothetical protein